VVRVTDKAEESSVRHEEGEEGAVLEVRSSEY